MFLKLVDQFSYLGNNILFIESNVNACTVKSWIAIHKLSIIWKSDLSEKN